MVFEAKIHTHKASRATFFATSNYTSAYCMNYTKNKSSQTQIAAKCSVHSLIWKFRSFIIFSMAAEHCYVSSVFFQDQWKTNLLEAVREGLQITEPV